MPYYREVPAAQRTDTRTELAEIRTTLGNIDLSRGVATVTLLTRYRVLRTVTNTRVLGTLMIVSRYVTAVNRTYTLTYGNIRTSVTTMIPTRYLETVYTMTAQTLGEARTQGQQAQSAQQVQQAPFVQQLVQRVIEPIQQAIGQQTGAVQQAQGAGTQQTVAMRRGYEVLT